VNRSVTDRAPRDSSIRIRRPKEERVNFHFGICWEGGDRWFYNGSMHVPERNIALSNFHTITFEASPRSIRDIDCYRFCPALRMAGSSFKLSAVTPQFRRAAFRTF